MGPVAEQTPKADIRTLWREVTVVTLVETGVEYEDKEDVAVVDGTAGKAKVEAAKIAKLCNFITAGNTDIMLCSVFMAVGGAGSSNTESSINQRSNQVQACGGTSRVRGGLRGSRQGGNKGTPFACLNVAHNEERCEYQVSENGNISLKNDEEDAAVP